MTTKKKKINKKKSKRKVTRKKRRFVTVTVIVFLGVLFTLSTYAWLSTSLNVEVKNFKMVVSRNSGLSISLDGITFSTSIEVSSDRLLNQLQATYPDNISQWAGNGLIPVSTPGILSPNDSKFII